MPTDSVLFTDSRGIGIQQYIQEVNYNNMTVGMIVHPQKGAGLQKLADIAIDFSMDFPGHNIYIAGGICDYTFKNPQTKIISFFHKDEGALIKHMCDLVEHIDHYTHVRRPHTKFIICPLVGVDVEAYIPKIAAVREGLQDIMTNATMEVNNHILTVNNRRGYRVPYLATRIHSWHHNKVKHHYERLATDGIHLTDDLKQNWAAAFVKAVEKN